MTQRPIGYYVHHQGAGHWQRACGIADALERPCTLIGTFDVEQRAAAGRSLIDLPDDRIAGFEGRDGEFERPRGLHYAPLGVPSVRARMAQIAGWIDACDPALMIVDVSVEIALLARLMSVPTVMVRLAGRRDDEPHLEAFRSAERLLAPFPPEFDDPGLPPWIGDKTFFAGLLSSPPRLASRAEQADKIVVLFGRGGQGGDLSVLAAAARTVPDAQWHVLGPVAGRNAQAPPNLHLHGWVEPVDAHLVDAALVIGAAGDGTLASVAAHGKRFVCIPEPRPFDEQRVKAEALARTGALILRDTWASVADWGALVRAGMSLDPSVIARFANPDGLRRTADAIEALAREIEARPRRMGAHLR